MLSDFLRDFCRRAGLPLVLMLPPPVTRADLLAPLPSWHRWIPGHLIRAQHRRTAARRAKHRRRGGR